MKSMTEEEANKAIADLALKAINKVDNVRFTIPTHFLFSDEPIRVILPVSLLEALEWGLSKDEIKTLEKAINEKEKKK